LPKNIEYRILKGGKLDMRDAKAAPVEKQKESTEESLSASFGIRSLCKSKKDKRKVTKDSIAFCCSKSGLDERDINQCTHTVI
jgi:hypothetical protein